VARSVDAGGRLVVVSERDDATWNAALFSYDLLGNPTRTVDPAGNVTSYDFNSLDQKLAQDDPDLGASSYTYDSNGLLLTETDARGERTELGHDPLGRMISKRLGAQGDRSQIITFVHDEARAGYFNVGHLSTMIDAAGSATFDHDAGGRGVRETRSLDGTTHAFARSYDPGNRLLGTRYPDGDVVGDDPATVAQEPSLRYDAAGKLTSIPGLVDRVSYHPSGQLAEIANRNGTTSSRTYSPTRSWIDTIRTMRGPTRVQDLTYARDGQGKITAVASPIAGDTWSYGYDVLGRLARATRSTGAAEEQTFSYDKLGNMLANSRLGAYRYPPTGARRPHAVTSAGALSFLYDAAGNMLEGNGRRHEWDAAGDLVKVTAGSDVTTFVYDGDGDRLTKNFNGAVTRYLGEDYEIAPDGTVTKYFRVGEELVAKKVGAKLFWLHADHQDSIAVITDEGGEEVRRERHRAYGESLERAGSQADSFGYTGQRVDETGLVYLHARYYDPEIGRFLSPDTETPGDLIVALNRYAYAFNDPLGNTDPTGHWPKIKWSSVGWFVAKVVVVGAASALGTVACGPPCAIGAGIVVGMAFDKVKAVKQHEKWDPMKSLVTNSIESGLGFGAGKLLGKSELLNKFGEKVGEKVAKGGEKLLEKVTKRSRYIPRHSAPKHSYRSRDWAHQRNRPRDRIDETFGETYRLAGVSSSVTAIEHRMEMEYHRSEPRRATGGGGCFVAGTMVTMADGTQKAIDQIQVGEQVLAFDEVSARLLPARVTERFVHPDWQEQADTILINGRLRATTNHPFLVNGRWQRADQIQPGDIFRTLTPVLIDNGPVRTMLSEPVLTLVPLPGVETVYNLEVEGYHTYFAEGVLVHNMKAVAY
jgi:RHS repeat-associated protein